MTLCSCTNSFPSSIHIHRLENDASKISRLEEHLRKNTLEGIVLRKRVDYMLEKMKRLEAENAKLKKESEDAKEELRSFMTWIYALEVF
jgi:uncharacterized protein (UPF0335 family)